MFLCFYICQPSEELCQDVENGKYPLLFRVVSKELRFIRQNQKRRRNEHNVMTTLVRGCLFIFF